MTRRTAAEIIAFHFCTNIQDIKDYRYQQTRYANPAVYSIGDSYWVAPSNNQPPRYRDVGSEWIEVAEHYGRKVYRARVS